MGKKRIAQLLDQLQTNQQADLQNAAGVFTVAQVAINALSEPGDVGPTKAISTLPAPSPINQVTLMQQYGSYNACRRAAKKKGITLKHPTWAQLVAAFQYWEAWQGLIERHLEQHPEPLLKGVMMQFKVKK